MWSVSSRMHSLGRGIREEPNMSLHRACARTAIVVAACTTVLNAAGDKDVSTNDVRRNTTNPADGQPTCYPNCDGSSVSPILTANDFTCFLNAFSGGSSYANCDGSTVPPVLTANDFTCFLNKFASGCS